MKFSLQQTLKNGVKHNSKALILTMAKMTLRAQKEWVFTPKNVGRMLTLLKRLKKAFG